MTLHGTRRTLSSPSSSSSSSSAPWPAKALQATTTSASALIILGGLGVCGGLLYLVGTELFSASSPTHLFTQSLKLLQDHPDLTARFGTPLRGYGEPSSSRAQRNRHVMAQEFLDPSGYTYWRMRFYIVGPITHPSTSILDTLTVYWEGLRDWVERTLDPDPSPSLPVMKEVERQKEPSLDDDAAEGVVHVNARRTRSGWSITELYVDVPGLTEAQKSRLPEEKTSGHSDKSSSWWPWSSSSSSSTPSPIPVGPHRVHVIRAPTIGLSRASPSYMLYKRRAEHVPSSDEGERHEEKGHKGGLSRLVSYFRPSSSS
ncbi:MAG: TIM21-domain-containing protein [Piptocephalis tieghemiana]|nr:MAG: TIM21-domain-containing protein [Piptocephalis tieghemiana]